MWGNVDSPLSRQSNDTEVDGKGWMQWAPGEQSAVFTVGITQGGVSGTGSKTYRNPGGDPRENWQIPVKAAGNQKFQKGQAMASVTAVVTYANPPTTTVNWTAQVDLK
jgi:hypothetical protein